MKKKILVSTVAFSLMTGTLAPFAEAASNPTTDKSLAFDTTLNSGLTLVPDKTETLPDGTIVETFYEKGDVPVPYNTPTSSVLLDEQALSSDDEMSASGVYGTTWVAAGTKKYTSKVVWTTAAAASGAIGVYLKIPHFTAGAILINWIVTNKDNWVYYSDKQSFRMAGATLQVKHEVTFYSDSARTKKISSQTYITNDNGGK